MTKSNKEAVAIMLKGFGLAFWFLAAANLLGMYVVIPAVTTILIVLGTIIWHIGKYLDLPPEN